MKKTTGHGVRRAGHGTPGSAFQSRMPRPVRRAPWPVSRVQYAVLALLMLLWAAPAFSQGCAMCYNSAKGASQEGQRAISRGVLVLLVPPVGFMTVGIGLAFEYGRRRDQESKDAPDENAE